MYDHMAYETSVKVKKSFRINTENGNFVGSSVIYGYRKNPEDIHKLIIDDDKIQRNQYLFLALKIRN